MHIEPGVLNAAKIVYANAAAATVVLGQSRSLWRAPPLIISTLLAALFFSLFMEIYHVKIGPSELHFVGASVVYAVSVSCPPCLALRSACCCRALSSSPEIWSISASTACR